jgi:hypothetical protein
MKRLDEDLAQMLWGHSQAVPKPSEVFAVKKENSLIVMNNHWLLEWRLRNVDLTCKKVRRFLQLAANQNTDRIRRLSTDPWVKHIAPIVDFYYPAEEVDPTDEEIDAFDEQDPDIIYAWKRSGRMPFSSTYVAMIENVFEEPPGYYMYADKDSRRFFLVFSDGNKRIGCLAPTGDKD